MANRYLIGSGAFTSTSIWSTTYNGSGGASVPVSGDIIYVDNSYDISGLPNDSSFDFIVYLGANSSNSVTLNLYSSLTFRLLDIRSANSAAHTVNFEADITVNKFIGIGSSTRNRLTLHSQYGTEGLLFTDYGSSYASNLNFDAAYMYDKATFAYTTYPLYIGSSSISGADGNISFQDPPKISTLVDPLTTAPGSNSNWTVTGTVTQVTTGHGGGGYEMFGGGNGIISSNTFDLVDSSIILDIPYSVHNPIFSVGDYGISGISIGMSEDVSFITPLAPYTSIGFASFPNYIKISISSGVLKVESLNSSGGVLSTIGSKALTSDELVYMRSIRIRLGGTESSTIIAGSINPSMSTVVTKAQDGRARISKVITSSRQSQSRIAKLFSATNNSISRVGKLFWTDQVSISRLQNISASAQESLANIRATFTYSRGSYDVLPSDPSDLDNTYTPTEVFNVGAEDSIYTNQSGSGYVLHQYKVYHNLDTATATIKWVGKTTVSPTEETVSLQIYNHDSNSWVTLDSDSTSSAGADFQLLGAPTGDNRNYYDPDGFLAVRVYQ